MLSLVGYFNAKVKRIMWRGLFLVAVASGATFGAEAGVDDLSQMRHAGWTTKEGLPLGVRNALAQTSDGFIWLGGTTGLFRFDGTRFERYELPVSGDEPQPRVFSLFAPPSGGLWIGFLFGGAALLKDGKLSSYPPGQSFPSGSTRTFASAPDGTLWLGTSTGLAWFDGQKMHQVEVEPGKKTYVGNLAFDGDGNLWLATRGGFFWRTAGSTKFEKFDAVGQASSSVSLAVSQTGDVWAETASQDGSQIVQLLHRSKSRHKTPLRYANELMFHSDGSFWKSTDAAGVQRLTHPESFLDAGKIRPADMGAAFNKRDGLTSNSAGRMLEDREGNVWVLTSSGLDRFAERHVKALSLPDLSGVRNDTLVVSAIAYEPNGRLWIANETDAAESVKGHELRRWPMLKAATSLSVAGDDLWLASNVGLYRKRHDDSISKVAFPPEASQHDLQNMAASVSGDVWISIVRLGTFRYRNGRWDAFGALDGLPKQPAIVIGATSSGGFWFGYPKNLVAVVDGDQVKSYGREDGLATGNVTAIHLRGPTAWIGGDNGLARIEAGRVMMLRSLQAHRFDNICGIVQAADGDVWIIGSAGIVRIPQEQLDIAARDPAHRIDSEVFDEHEGVKGGAVRLRPLPTAIEGGDGRIWFLTDADLYYVDPARLKRNPLPPLVQVSSLTVDGQPHSTAGAVTLPSRAALIRLDYVGLSLTLPEKVQYRYRLEGVDTEWQEVGSRREALYTNLPPGSYRFHLRAANNDGVWSDDAVPVVLVMPPAFTQTWAFYVLCALGIAALFALALRLRVRSATARVRRTLEARLAERERIARDLHDTLLQGMQGLLWKIQGIVSSMPPTDTSREPLTDVIEGAERVLVEGRDRVQGLRAFAEDDRTLDEALSQAASDIAASIGSAGKIAVDVRTVGAARALQPDVKDEAFSIAREALVNAFRHAEANRIDVTLGFTAEGFSLEVRDDGKGLAQENAAPQMRPGHWGLAGMRERAAQIGAQFDVESRPNAGTTVRLRVSADIAYSARRRPS